MRQPLGMPDLQRAFPLIGRSLQQLLDFEPAEQVCLVSLCVSVCRSSVSSSSAPRPPIPRWCPVRAWLFFTYTYLPVCMFLQVEETFALCMHVAYEEFGERKVFDLVEGGGEVPVTGASRANYVLRPTEKKKDAPAFSFVSASISSSCFAMRRREEPAEDAVTARCASIWDTMSQI